MNDTVDRRNDDGGNSRWTRLTKQKRRGIDGRLVRHTHSVASSASRDVGNTPTTRESQQHEETTPTTVKLTRTSAVVGVVLFLLRTDTDGWIMKVSVLRGVSIVTVG